mmetsp:Transcript_124529/g.265494  ORF Transcript_124529/g.265494 Transcript_124529/m.265494 type:complete len:279 (+) Transcript_124529:421-1257(+)
MRRLCVLSLRWRQWPLQEQLLVPHCDAELLWQEQASLAHGRGAVGGHVGLGLLLLRGAQVKVHTSSPWTVEVARDADRGSDLGQGHGLLLARFRHHVLEQGHLAENVRPHFGDVVLDEDEKRVAVAALHLVNLLHELVVVNLPGAVLVHDAEDQADVVPGDIHGPERVGELGVRIEALAELKHGEVAVAVLVHFGADLEKPLSGLLILVRLHLDDLLQVFSMRLLGTIDDHSEDQVQGSEVDAEDGPHKDHRRPRVSLDDGHCDVAPAVTCDDLLDEG